MNLCQGVILMPLIVGIVLVLVLVLVPRVLVLVLVLEATVLETSLVAIPHLSAVAHPSSDRARCRLTMFNKA